MICKVGHKWRALLFFQCRTEAVGPSGRFLEAVRTCGDLVPNTSGRKAESIYCFSVLTAFCSQENNQSVPAFIDLDGRDK